MFKNIIKIINEYDSIVIFGHIHPDGDSYGSGIALREILKETYPTKQVFAVGVGMPDFYAAISPMDVVSDDVIKNSLAILIDANSLDRSEDARIYNAKSFCKIDHHVDLHNFTEGPEVIVDQAVSTCEILFDFATKNNLKINKIAAKALFLGMLTDSGRFQFYEDFEKAFSMSKVLVEYGADPKETYEILNKTDELAIKLNGYILNNYKKTDHGVIYFVMPYDKVKMYGEDTRGIANNIRYLCNIKGYDIAVAFVEFQDHRMVMEFRSPCYNIQKLAAKYGGGGHIHASGLTISEFSEDNIKMILDECDQIILKGDKE